MEDVEAETLPVEESSEERYAAGTQCGDAVRMLQNFKIDSTIARRCCGLWTRGDGSKWTRKQRTSSFTIPRSAMVYRLAKNRARSATTLLCGAFGARETNMEKKVIRARQRV
jgi:hypothetical protein